MKTNSDKIVNFVKIGSGRGPGTTPGDPKMLELSTVVVPWLEVGDRGASQGRFWSDFGLILGSLLEHFWVHFGS